MKKEDIRKIMEIPGKVRGAVFRTDAEYVREKKGEKGLKLLKDETKKLGYPIDYEKISVTEWYPLGLRVVSLLAAQKAFAWRKEETKNMGEAAPKYSFIVKILVKHFLTLKKSIKESPEYWRKHYTVGELSIPEFNEKEKYVILRIEEFKAHPILCTYLAGFFITMIKFVMKSRKKIKSAEIKCVFKGDPYHEYLIKWE